MKQGHKWVSLRQILIGGLLCAAFSLRGLELKARNNQKYVWFAEYMPPILSGFFPYNFHIFSPMLKAHSHLWTLFGGGWKVRQNLSRGCQQPDEQWVKSGKKFGVCQPSQCQWMQHRNIEVLSILLWGVFKTALGPQPTRLVFRMFGFLATVWMFRWNRTCQRTDARCTLLISTAGVWRG